MVTKAKETVLLRQAVEAARIGNKIVARALLREINETDPGNEQAWLWRAALAETAEESVEHLERVLAINPNNKQASSRLTVARLCASAPAPEHTGGRGQVPRPDHCFFCQTQMPETGWRCSRCGAILCLDELSGLAENSGVDQGLLRKALESGRQRLAAQPSFDAYYQLALACLNLNSSAEAVPLLTQASKLEPGYKRLKSQLEDLRRRKLILAVDDSLTVQRVVALTLERKGYRVLAASDGMQALSLINDQLPDLVLLDITMPRMDGYQVCRVIKQNGSTGHIPVIMLSGKDGFFDRVKGRLAGASDYVTKPFERDVLADTVEKYLKTKQGANP